jgi:hypothetical protein
MDDTVIHLLVLKWNRHSRQNNAALIVDICGFLGFHRVQSQLSGGQAIHLNFLSVGLGHERLIYFTSHFFDRISVVYLDGDILWEFVLSIHC